MKIQALSSFATIEHSFAAGEVKEVADSIANELIAGNLAIEIADPVAEATETVVQVEADTQSADQEPTQPDPQPENPAPKKRNTKAVNK